MANTFGEQSISSAIYAHWKDAFALEAATVFPGTRINTAALEEWVEIAIEQWTRPAERAAGKESLRFTIVVHCFAKPSREPRRIQELADAGRSALEQQTIAVRDYETSGAPLLGWASLFEADVRDLTRAEAGRYQSPLFHQVVTIRGVARESG